MFSTTQFHFVLHHKIYYGRFTMAKHPNEPSTAVVQVQAEFVQDPQSGEWILTSQQTPRLSVRNMDVRRARKALEKEISAKLGKPVEIIEKIKLPKHLADQVAEYQRDIERLNELKASIQSRFMPLVKQLLRERLQQQQIADLLKVSTQWLGQQLKHEATGTHRRNDR